MEHVVRRCVAVILVLLLAGCAEPDFPRDPEGTLIRASGGPLLVGVSSHPPHVDVADDGAVTGAEAEIVEAYAESIGATVEWREGAESELMELLKLGQVDLVIGGLASDSPWSTHAAFTRPYTRTVGPDGKSEKLVIAVRQGENALLSNLERFLIAEGHEG
ncbi:substrate-binding periplasmic protein [Tessaracoccus sp. G1721]